MPIFDMIREKGEEREKKRVETFIILNLCARVCECFTGRMRFSSRS